MLHDTHGRTGNVFWRFSGKKPCILEMLDRWEYFMRFLGKILRFWYIIHFSRFLARQSVRLVDPRSKNEKKILLYWFWISDPSRLLRFLSLSYKSFLLIQFELNFDPIQSLHRKSKTTCVPLPIIICIKVLY